MVGPVSTRPLRPAAREVLLALAALALAEVLFALALGVAGARPQVGVGWMFAGVVRTALAAGLYAGLARALEPESADPPAGRPAAGVALAVGIFAGLSAVAGSYLLGLAQTALDLAPREQPGVVALVERLRASGRWWEHAGFVGAAVVLAPAAEEWFFRGLWFRRLRARAPAAAAYGISALGFAAIHANPSGMAIYAWLGLCFAWALDRTGRLWPAVLAHAANNAAVVALLYLGLAPGAQT